MVAFGAITMAVGYLLLLYVTAQLLNAVHTGRRNIEGYATWLFISLILIAIGNLALITGGVL